MPSFSVRSFWGSSRISSPCPGHDELPFLRHRRPAATEEWKRPARLLAVAAVGGLVMTAWDLVIDPFMVAAGYWVWETRGPYFGIPLQNFWGWWLTVFTSLALYLLIPGKAARPASPGFDRLAVSSYLITMLGAVGISLLARAGGPALVGFFAMVPWFVTGWLRTARG